jgi:hypothetical protein
MLWSGVSRERARTSRSRGRVRGSRAPVQGCGPRCSGSCASCDPVGSSLRTSLLSELEALTAYSVTWKEKATPAGRSWWVLGRSGLRTRGTGSGSWPTAAATPYGNNRGGGAGRVGPIRPSLEGMARDLWATPDWKTGIRPSPTFKNGSLTLYGQVGLGRKAGPLAPESPSTSGRSRGWPTAQARDAANRSPDPMRVGDPKRHGGYNLDDWVAKEEWGQRTKGRGVLNSRWVAQLMGYPSDWLDVGTESLSKLWGTPSSRRSSRSSGGQSRRRS